MGSHKLILCESWGWRRAGNRSSESIASEKEGQPVTVCLLSCSDSQQVYTWDLCPFSVDTFLSLSVAPVTLSNVGTMVWEFPAACVRIQVCRIHKQRVRSLWPRELIILHFKKASLGIPTNETWWSLWKQLFCVVLFAIWGLLKHESLNPIHFTFFFRKEILYNVVDTLLCIRILCNFHFCSATSFVEDEEVEVKVQFL